MDHDRLIAIKSGGQNLRQLTDFCREIVAKGNFYLFRHRVNITNFKTWKNDCLFVLFASAVKILFQLQFVVLPLANVRWRRGRFHIRRKTLDLSYRGSFYCWIFFLKVLVLLFSCFQVDQNQIFVAFCGIFCLGGYPFGFSPPSKSLSMSTSVLYCDFFATYVNDI